jgi:hypothetical protein
LAQRILEHVRKTILIKKRPPVILKWRQDLTDSGQEGVEAQEKESSRRNRNIQVTRSDDFLSTATSRKETRWERRVKSMSPVSSHKITL